MSEVDARRPGPILTADNQDFWRAAAQGRLVAQRCGACGRLRHPPRPMCPHCRSLAIELVDLAGTGTVYSYAILHHPQHPAFDYPIVAALVTLDEGVRIATHLVDIGPMAVRIDLPVEVTFRPSGDDLAIPVFRPRRDPA